MGSAENRYIQESVRRFGTILLLDRYQYQRVVGHILGNTDIAVNYSALGFIVIQFMTGKIRLQVY